MCICNLLFCLIIFSLTHISVGYIAYDAGVTRGRIIEIDKQLKKMVEVL